MGRLAEDLRKLAVERIAYSPCRIVVEVASLMGVGVDAKGLALDITPCVEPAVDRWETSPTLFPLTAPVGYAKRTVAPPVVVGEALATTGDATPKREAPVMSPVARDEGRGVPRRGTL